MSERVPADQIEEIVGVERHPTEHRARCDTEAQMVYVLHSHACVQTGVDLRLCRFSRALNRTIDDRWRGWEDRPVVVSIDPETHRLIPNAAATEELLREAVEAIFPPPLERLAKPWETAEQGDPR